MVDRGPFFMHSTTHGFLNRASPVRIWPGAQRKSGSDQRRRYQRSSWVLPQVYPNLYPNRNGDHMTTTDRLAPLVAGLVLAVLVIAGLAHAAREFTAAVGGLL